MATGESIREMLEGGGDESQPPVKEGEEKEKETTEPEKEVPETEEEDTGEGEERREPSDDDEVDEDVAPVKEDKTAFARLKKEAGAKELLKKFPEVEDAFYEHREYRKVFGSIEEAKDAQAKSEYFTGLVPELLKGNIEPLLNDINDKDPEAVAAIAMNFLPMLSKNSPKLFNSVVTPIINNLFNKLAREAQQTNNDDLAAAVEYLSQKILGKANPERMEVRQFTRKTDEREEQAIRGRAEVFYEAIADSVEAKLDAEINRGLDPDNVLTKGLRETAVEKIRNKVLKMLKNDEEHMSIMRSLDKSARADGYSKEQRARVIRQIVNAARNVIPDIRSRVKQDMFGNMFTKNNGEKGRIEGGREEGGSSGNLPFNPDKVDWNQTSLRDALDMDASKVVLKK